MFFAPPIIVWTEWTPSRKSTHKIENRSCLGLPSDPTAVPHVLQGWFCYFILENKVIVVDGKHGVEEAVRAKVNINLL